MRDLGVRTAAFTGLEGFFHAAIFAGVKRENGDSATRLQAERKIVKERIQHAEFVVHGDSQRLENTPHGVVVSSGAANNCSKLCRRRHRRLQDGLRHAIRGGFVGASAGSSRLASSALAVLPRCGFMRRSSGPSYL